MSIPRNHVHVCSKSDCLTCRNLIRRLTNWCLDAAPKKRFGCQCSSPCISGMRYGQPSPSRCGRNHNQNTVQLGGLWYQFFLAAQGDCLRYHHHYLFRSPPNRNDMEMSVVNLVGEHAEMKINEFPCATIFLFHLFTIASLPSRLLHSEFSIQNGIPNEVNRLCLKDSTMTFSRDNLKQIAPHKINIKTGKRSGDGGKIEHRGETYEIKKTFKEITKNKLS